MTMTDNYSIYAVVKHRNKRFGESNDEWFDTWWDSYKDKPYQSSTTSYATDKRSPVIYRFNQSTNISAHLQAFQIDPDFNTLKIFTLTLISKIMKVFTTTTTITSLYDILLIDRIIKKLYFKIFSI